MRALFLFRRLFATFLLYPHMAGEGGKERETERERQTERKRKRGWGGERDLVSLPLFRRALIPS